MSNLIVCLGYDLDENGGIPPILALRLDKTMELLQADQASNVLLMGSFNYRDAPSPVSQAAAMKHYLVERGVDDDKIVIDETTTSAVEQLCHLRTLIDAADPLVADAKITIVSTEVFDKRVQLYDQYIFTHQPSVEYVAAALPPDVAASFTEAETPKLAWAKQWLSSHTKGDYQSILREQRAFQERIKAGAVDHPRS